MEGNITISGLTDTNLTALANIFPLLAEVQGNLLIQNNANVATITGFVALREAGGNVEIGGAMPANGNAALTDAPALEALATIGGSFVIGNNGVLTTAPVLSAIESIGGDFTVLNNAQLSDCCDFRDIVAGMIMPGVAPIVGGATLVAGNTGQCANEVEIATCPVEIVVPMDLTINSSTLAGFAPLVPSVVQITGSLTVSGNLAEFPNFATLRVVTGNLIIEGLTNATLTEITNIFPALEEVQGDIFIRNNANLLTIRGFAALRAVGFNITIERNVKLQTITGFGSLTSIPGSFALTFNTALSSCCAFFRLANGAISPRTIITGNATGCASSEQVTNTCSFTVDDDADVAPTTLMRIEGDLTIGGSITTFPVFDVLEVVTGSLSIRGLSDENLTSLTGIFPALTEVQGNLFIEDNVHVTTITGFASLATIRGNLEIGDGRLPTSGGNTAFTSLPDFPALTSVGGSIRIADNDNLTSVSGFGALQTIGRSLNIASEIEGNNGSLELTTVSGFGALTSIGEDLNISVNPKLTTVSGFGALTSIGRNTRIIDNDKLASVSGFGALQTIRGSLVIGSLDFGGFSSGNGNPLLTTLPDFPALTSIGGGLEFFLNAKLTTLPTFAQLAGIEGLLFIVDNAELTTVSGFGALTSIGEDLNIADNDKLATLSGFDLLGSVGGDLNIGVPEIPAEFPGDSPTPAVGNPLLTTIPTFASLTTITGSLNVVLNVELTDLSAFNALTTLGEDLNIEGECQTDERFGF